MTHHDVTSVRGPLLVVRGARGVGWDEFAEIDVDGQPTRHGLVLEVDRDLAVLQVLEGTDGMTPGGVGVRFEGRPLHVAVGPAWLGRVCNGRGEPARRRPARCSARSPRRSTAGRSTRCTASRRTSRCITGVSAIDALTTLVRGQKLPIFSVPGLPHLRLATQIAAQASTGSAGSGAFRVVFAGDGADPRRHRLRPRRAGGALRRW